ncbi:MAG: LlaJI family restriction endonuclease [Firmicutes bacterium]|nr:LlaJI family restriction endonuclease [Bacillota bacterium]
MSKVKRSLDGKMIGFSIDKKSGLTLTVPKFIENISNEKGYIEKEIFQYFKIFKKYRRQNLNQKNIKEQDYYRSYIDGNNEDKKYTFSLIELYLTLLNDYREKGLLLFRKRNVNLKKKGNINWQKTMKSSQELITNNSVLYREIFHNNLSIDYQHPITILHALTLMKLEKLLSIKLKLPYDYRYLKQFENSTNYIKGILQRYQREMFSDREKKIFKILQHIYLDKKNKKNLFKCNQQLDYVEKFDLIWEKMLKVALDDEYNDIKENIPKGSYLLKNHPNDSYTSFGGLRAIPDILIKKECHGKDYLFVLDAKNYVPNFKDNVGMPQSHDIIKQIFYKYFMSKEFHEDNKYHSENIINAFLLPTELNTPEKIRYIGIHSLEDSFKFNNTGKILCFYIDFNQLRQVYLNPNKKYKKEVLDYILDTYNNLY